MNNFRNRNYENKEKNKEENYEKVKKLLDCLDSKEKLKELLIQKNGVIELDNIVKHTFGDITQTQLRKFYDEIKILDRELKENKNVKDIKLKIALLIPKVTYSKSRKVIKNENFINFMNTSLSKLSSINNDDEFKEKFTNFKTLFESIIAFAKTKER